MKTISITASEAELNSFGIEKSEMAFAEFVDTVGRELARRNLAKCVEISEKLGLADLTLEEINAEIEAVRHAKINP